MAITFKTLNNMYKLPIKEEQHIHQSDIDYYGEARFLLVPGKTTSWGHLRHRTMLHHPCWFSRDVNKQALSVKQCIEKHPSYMLWVYENLSINWSVYVIYLMEEMNILKAQPKVRSGYIDISDWDKFLAQ